MKKLSLASVLMVAGLSGSGLAMAEATQGSGQSGPGQGQNLDTIKQRIEQRIQARISKMQGILDCVQNAQDRQSLRSCLPRRGNYRGRGNEPGRQHGNG